MSASGRFGHFGHSQKGSLLRRGPVPTSKLEAGSIPGTPMTSCYPFRSGLRKLLVLTKCLLVWNGDKAANQRNQRARREYLRRRTRLWHCLA